jgi:hypothetical protein
LVDVVEILVPTSPTIIEVLIPWEPIVLPSITLSGSIVTENAPFGTVIGTFGVINATGTPSFTLPDNAGGKFGIAGSDLVLIAALNYEIAISHTVIVAASGVGPTPPNRQFTITVIDEPKQMTLSNNTIAENAANGTFIGALAVWEGIGTYTFSIVSDPDNIFTLDDTDLDRPGILDYETQTSHEVTIRADNGAGDVIDQIFTIFVTDVLDTTPPVTYPPGTTGTSIFGGVYVNQTTTRQYIVGSGIYMNEVV